ncbi:glycosyltransferase [Endozoicomonas euniceicola]|uniref:Glycosyltransferase n=1 Tax=Endozoicomonas euniceicola TaxID=1234143 RepID=A0ABY6GSG1_9GAMM|nr:glycosyltransferase [Endozoicomonas euniceicola]UYM15702.1 glycosyltransferase [Endozoicomonas euniceicola]
MKFSVLMSLYEKEKPEFLNECLKSLSEQTLAADEVVIVYDGQITERLQKVVDYWKSELPIVIVKISKNKGLGIALQHGLENCSNEIVARMDTDDICLANRFETQINFFKKNKDIGCVGSWVAEFKGDIFGKNIIKKVPLSHQKIKRYARYRNPMNHMSVMFKKSDVIRSGGYKDFKFMEDYYLWLRMINAGVNFENIDSCLVYARAGKAMFERRGGKEYIVSEYKISRIKKNLGMQRGINRYLVLLLRSLIRLLSPSLRGELYNSVFRRV